MRDREDRVRLPEPRWLRVGLATSAAASAAWLQLAGAPGVLASVATFGTLAILAALALMRARIAALVGVIAGFAVVSFLMVGAVVLGLSGMGHPDCNTNCQAAAAADGAAVHTLVHAIVALLASSVACAIALVLTRRRRR